MNPVSIPRTDDFNGGRTIGAGFFQFTIKDGRRGSTSSTFLKQAKNRPNLRFYPIHTPEKLSFRIKSGWCGSAERENIRNIYAHKEIILSAGSFGSPHILMLRNWKSGSPFGRRY
ncbi:MAG: GMC family oxidoreductase N-terminal domain-containing protein [Bacteroidia bacterium]